ncbi:hypothetical protein K443DRAFT_349151 [Laccaria amethystina LaAM-08-1]|uniref:Uncharacterized protein n=1 Tax=Laccaria amethystina LaAM-08-1 TaxID=1095629 RepID=A0A0C9WJJ4_9AGAR|nr:hypothetical protein K443DRAFT_349151 [Laccaria amethystina LaAM-08-1]
MPQNIHNSPNKLRCLRKLNRHNTRNVVRLHLPLPRTMLHRKRNGTRAFLLLEVRAPAQDVGVMLIPELQFACCMPNVDRLDAFPRCVSCTRRWAGDTCRFQGIRYFMHDADGKLLGISFCESSSVSPPPTMEFLKKWNSKVGKEHARRSKLSIAKALLPTLPLEQDYLKVAETVRRPRESDVRATCDTCMTFLFSIPFMCRLCGREVRNKCFRQVRELN